MEAREAVTPLSWASWMVRGTVTCGNGGRRVVLGRGGGGAAPLGGKSMQGCGGRRGAPSLTAGEGVWVGVGYGQGNAGCESGP